MSVYPNLSMQVHPIFLAFLIITTTIIVCCLVHCSFLMTPYAVEAILFQIIMTRNIGGKNLSGSAMKVMRPKPYRWTWRKFTFLCKSNGTILRKDLNILEFYKLIKKKEPESYFRIFYTAFYTLGIFQKRQRELFSWQLPEF